MSDGSSICPKLGGFVAGAFAGCCGVYVSQPFDIIKVRLQNTGGSTMTVLSNLISREGPLAFWKGSGASILGSCFAHSTSFGVVESCKTYLSQNKQEPLSILDHAFCGMCSGSATSIISAPTEGVRIKMQTQGYLENRGDVHYRNSRIFALDLFKVRGFAGLYRGFFTTYLRDMIGDTFYFTTYQAVPSYVLGKSDLNEGKSFFEIVLSGGLAGMAFWTFTYPIDLLKSRIQADSLVNPKYKGTYDCFVKTLNEEGYKTFTRGYLSCLLRAFPVNIGLFLGFELAMKVIGRSY